MTGHLAVETERLRRVYTRRDTSAARPASGKGPSKKLVVLDDVTLSVRRGEIFGVLGVNGAGKTTLLQILATQLRPTSGTARVVGFDVGRYPAWVRRHVSVVCGDDGPAIRLRAPDLSSGERQRASLARAFAAGPRLLLLDQPTLGLDCAAAREMRAFIRKWTDEDPTRTVVIGTNDMREASELCDRVAILDAGRVVECDTPAALTQRVDPAPVAGAGPRLPGSALLEQVFLSIVGRASVLRSPRATV